MQKEVFEWMDLMGHLKKVSVLHFFHFIWSMIEKAGQNQKQLQPDDQCNYVIRMMDGTCLYLDPPGTPFFGVVCFEVFF